MSLFIESVLTKDRSDGTKESSINQLWDDIYVKVAPAEYYINNYVEFGGRDLFITHSQSSASSVWFTYGRYEIVFAGVIYNKQSIQEELLEEGFRFETSFDSELLCALYDHKKEGALDDLRGKFSFIIWDKQRDVLFGARDHFGIKPLYYMKHGSGIYFANETKAFQEYVKSTEVKNEALHHYFSFQYVPEPITMYENVYMLEPGTYFYRELNES